MPRMQLIRTTRMCASRYRSASEVSVNKGSGGYVHSCPSLYPEALLKKYSISHVVPVLRRSFPCQTEHFLLQFMLPVSFNRLIKLFGS